MSRVRLLSPALVAVYSDEVDELDRLSLRLMEYDDPAAAVSEWLRAFVGHVADKRDLAHALPDDAARSSHFEGWHRTMTVALARLVDRGHEVGTVRTDVSAQLLLVACSGLALTSGGPEHRDALLDLLRTGYLG